MMNPYFKGKWLNLKRNELNVSKFLGLTEKISFYDLGSAGGIPPPFCWIPEGIDLINFEPDPRGISSSEGNTLPIAIGPKEFKTIYLNQRPTTSSLLKPCKKVIDRYDFSRMFKDEGDIFRTIGEQDVKTYGLDELIELKKLRAPDFLKIDVQGLSYEVLESSENSLRNSVIGIQIEVEFLETYQGQKTFGFVHEFLYGLDFELFRLSNLNKWHYKTGLKIKKTTGQDVFCDLLYFKKIDSIADQSGFWTEEKAVKALLLFLIHDLNDTAAAYFEKFIIKNILIEDMFDTLRDMISEWECALNFFYDDEKRLTDKILDISPRRIIRSLKRTFS